MNIRKDDTVVVLSGDDKGAKGKVIAVSPKEGKVLVEQVNVIHKHVKPRRQGESGGIIDAEGAIYASKVALYCPKCGKGVRVHHEIVQVKDENGKPKRKVIRVCSGYTMQDGKKVACGHKFD